MSMSSAVGVWLEKQGVPPQSIADVVARLVPEFLAEKLRVFVYERATPPATWVSVHLDGTGGPLETMFDASVPVAEELARRLACRTWAFGGFCGTDTWLEVAAFGPDGKAGWRSKGGTRAPYTKFLKDLGAKGSFFTIEESPFLDAAPDWKRRANRRLGTPPPDYRTVAPGAPEVLECVGRPLEADRILVRERVVGKRSVSELWARVLAKLPADAPWERVVRRYGLVPADAENGSTWAELDHDDVPDGIAMGDREPLAGLPSESTGETDVIRDARVVIDEERGVWLRVVAARGAATAREKAWAKSSAKDAAAKLAVPDFEQAVVDGDVAALTAPAAQAALREHLEEVVALAVSQERWDLLRALAAHEPATHDHLREAVQQAMSDDDLARIPKLLALGVRFEGLPYDSTPLQNAIGRGDPALVEDLLDAGAAPDGVAANGRTPLHHARAPALVHLLCARKADPNARDKNGATPLMLVVYDREPGTPRVVEALLAHGASIDVRFGKVPLLEQVAIIASNRKGPDGKVTRAVLKLLQAAAQG